MKRDIKPTAELPLADAADELTGFEVLGIEKHYGCKLEQIGGVALTMGVVWAYENRDDKKTAWTVVEGMRLCDLNGYFPDPPGDLDEDEPDSALGKDS